MIGGEFEKGVDLSRRMCIQSIADVSPKWSDIRNSHILPNRQDMFGTVDILYTGFRLEALKNLIKVVCFTYRYEWKNCRKSF